MTKFTDSLKQAFVKSLLQTSSTHTRAEIENAAKEMGYPYPRFIIDNKSLKQGRGLWDLSNFDPLTTSPVAEVQNAVSTVVQAATVTQIEEAPKLRQKRLQNEFDNMVPDMDANFVAHGFFKDLSTILKSQDFFPVYITGLSGNGKTSMVEQVCARLKREMVRVNISIETDEDDLIGGATLIDGNVVYREGPVLTAMRRGAVLLLDEVDRGSNKLMCLQSVLEGKAYLNKKTGEVIKPAPGFTVVATANTKGRGTDDGKFIAAQILDEAFLERFSITVEQQYATPSIEKKIVANYMAKYNVQDPEFGDKLVAWADIIRRTFSEGGVDEIISTRRVVDVVKTFSKFGDRKKAIDLCTNRFDEETKAAFRDLYTKLDSPEPSSDATISDPAQATTIQGEEEIPF